MRTLDWIALVLIILGALNWGVVSLLDYNMFGLDYSIPGSSRAFYGLVGLAALYMIYALVVKREVLLDYDRNYAQSRRVATRRTEV